MTRAEYIVLAKRTLNHCRYADTVRLDPVIWLREDSVSYQGLVGRVDRSGSRLKDVLPLPSPQGSPLASSAGPRNRPRTIP